MIIRLNKIIPLPFFVINASLIILKPSCYRTLLLTIYPRPFLSTNMFHIFKHIQMRNINYPDYIYCGYPHLFFYLSTNYSHYVEKLCIPVSIKPLIYRYFFLTMTRPFNRIWIDVFQRHTFILYEKEVFLLWKWHFSLKRDKEQKFMASEAEWVLPADARFLETDVQRAEKFYQHNNKGHKKCGLFFCGHDWWSLPTD